MTDHGPRLRGRGRPEVPLCGRGRGRRQAPHRCPLAPAATAVATAVTLRGARGARHTGAPWRQHVRPDQRPETDWRAGRERRQKGRRRGGGEAGGMSWEARGGGGGEGGRGRPLGIRARAGRACAAARAAQVSPRREDWPLWRGRSRAAAEVAVLPKDCRRALCGGGRAAMRVRCVQQHCNIRAPAPVQGAAPGSTGRGEGVCKAGEGQGRRGGSSSESSHGGLVRVCATGSRKPRRRRVPAPARSAQFVCVCARGGGGAEGAEGGKGRNLGRRKLEQVVLYESHHLTHANNDQNGPSDSDLDVPSDSDLDVPSDSDLVVLSGSDLVVPSPDVFKSHKRWSSSSGLPPSLPPSLPPLLPPLLPLPCLLRPLPLRPHGKAGERLCACACAVCSAASSQGPKRRVLVRTRPKSRAGIRPRVRAARMHSPPCSQSRRARAAPAQRAREERA